MELLVGTKNVTHHQFPVGENTFQPFGLIMKNLWDYLRRDKKKVEGWLQRIDAEIMGAILEHQDKVGISGSCVEIGVHRGKSFIPICLSLRDDQLALGVDLFDDQSKNLDGDYKGNFELVKENLILFQVDMSKVRFFKGSSENLDSGTLLKEVGPVRYFSVDGGHWKSIVMNDLKLAESTLTQGGVIVLDDFCRASWPDVTAGYMLWQEETESDIIPFAAGSNKLFLCRRAFAAGYRDALKTPFLRCFSNSNHKAGNVDFDSYRVEIVAQDEMSISGVLGLVLKIFRPQAYVKLMSLLGRSA